MAFKASSVTGLTYQSRARVFDYTYQPALDPEEIINVNSARTNAFYVANVIHDITYRYGFTETAFNFQNNNYGKGGEGNDAIEISVQGDDAWNNAYFSTPPEYVCSYYPPAPF